MKKQNRKSVLTFLVNTAIILIIACVGFVGFYGGKAISITGDEYSAIYNGDRASDKVALMFNVYERTDNVKKIMEILKSRNATATFFVGGCWADDNTETLNEMVNGGFEIANHGYFHKDHKKLNLEKNKEEILLTEKIVEALCGYKTRLFAPPSGSFNVTTLKASAELGYKVIMWSKDTIDWRDSDEKLIIKRATNGVGGGDLILMHPKDVTVAVLGRILDVLSQSGLKPSTVTQTIS